MNSETKSHLENLLSALRLEKEDEITQYQSLIEGADYAQRIAEGITLYPLEFISSKFSDFGDQLIEFKVRPDQEGGAFRVGKIVNLFNADGELAEGQVSFYREDSIIIRSKDEELQDWIKKGKIGLNALVDTKTYDAYENAVQWLIDHDGSEMLHSFFDSTERIHAGSEYQSASLNTSQNEAVNQMLSDRKISIVHGPPGTGKTTTLVAGINKMIQLKKRVVICAPSNAAVDNICRKLLSDKINVVRLGNESKVEEDVMTAHLESRIRNDSSFSLVQKLKSQSDEIRKKAFKFKRKFGKEEYDERRRLKSDLKSLRSDIRRIQKDISKNIIEKAEVICGTFYSIRQFDFRDGEFDYLMVDEAGQAIEPAIWSVSQLGNKMVLAGDSYQLPPTVKSSKAAKLGLSKSLLEVADEMEYPRILLDVQYRMNSLIMEFSNQQFYNGQLKADSTVSDWCLKNNEYKAVEFIDTAGCGFEESSNDGSSISNPGEIGVVQKVLTEFDQESVGIITPYRAQLSLLRQLNLNADANTIDSFQGQERDVIIISLVRSNENAEIGFLKDYRRMNVAMTRAKKKLVVIGDSACIGQNSFYADFLDFVESGGSYRSAWEFAD